MPATNQFTGITMPVFSAFGWAGEETALKFAMAQLELFIEALYHNLSREIQSVLPHYGVDTTTRSVYLAVDPEPAKDLHIAFNARPLSLEISMNITDSGALTKAYRACSSYPETLYTLLTGLGQEWTLRLQQMQYDEDSDTATSYQDIYKDGIGKLDLDITAEIMESAAFRHGERQWIVPLYISRKTDSEKVAAMSTAVIPTMIEQITALLPLARFLTGQKPKSKARAAGKARAAVTTGAKEVVPEEKPAPEDLIQEMSSEKFIYNSQLKPLHIRRGFVNLTSRHWDFFATSARAETREVTVHYGDKIDRGCTVWRLQPDDLARLVLSHAGQEWLEDHFEADDYVKVTAIKSEDDTVVMTLSAVS